MARIEEVKFGIEIETFGHDTNEGKKLINSYWGYGSGWQAKYDSSINDDGDGVCEFVSPIMTFDDLDKLEGFVAFIKKHGCMVDKSCGIHVHVSHIEESVRSLVNIVRMVNARYDLLVRACVMSSYRKEQWNNRPNERMIHDMMTCNTLDELACVWYGSERDAWSGVARYNGKINRNDLVYHLEEHYDVSRYQLVNLHSYFCGKGVEIRAFNGSLDPKEVRAFVELSMAMYAKSINDKLSTNKARHNESSMARQMFDWMWSMELRGKNPKWKNTRYYMSRHLEGGWKV